MSGQSCERLDLSGQRGAAPMSGIASEDLNATLLCWGPGEGVSEHVNVERDVLIVVIAGSGVLSIDGEEQALDARDAVLVRKRAARAITAGPDGLRYLSVHRRRGPLQILPFEQRAD